RARGSPRGAYDLPGERGAEGLRRHRCAISRARDAQPRQGRRAARAGRRSRARTRGGGPMTQLVQVALAEDIAEAEELQTILNQAGIASELEPAVEHHPRGNEDTPQKVLVAEESLEAAQHAIEALTDPDELVSDACQGVASDARWRSGRLCRRDVRSPLSVSRRWEERR